MSDERRRLPPVHALLADAEAAEIPAPRAVLRDAVRAVLEAARARGGEAPAEGWVAAVQAAAAGFGRPSLTPVINATGVVLHTNLGRAPLAPEARDAVGRALGYSTLELDLQNGGRGSRQDHVRDLLASLTGAETALVVNNAASALFLTLGALAAGGETIVSRGELVEIGGSFRIPEILARSGSILTEVGTTNRTRLRDYELAVSPRTRLLLKVHRSNFHLAGFVAEAGIAELVPFGAGRGIPTVHDVGSGLLLSLERFGLRGEPLVADSIAAGATVIFSGDKLLGGPQAGIVAGPATIVEQLARHPLARAFRPDKATFAALEATLRLYGDPERALRAVPTLAMLTATAEDLRRRARRLARRIPGAGLEPGSSAVGGGAFPGCALPTTLVTLAAPSCEALLGRLRAHDPPVLARASEGRVVLDVRTLADDEFAAVAAAVRAAGWPPPAAE
jgi:L-seryl-tRNA(Ser) seleniumtransferase